MPCGKEVRVNKEGRGSNRVSVAYGEKWTHTREEIVGKEKTGGRVRRKEKKSKWCKRAEGQ